MFIVKVLANHLKKVVPSIVHDAQSAFIEDRDITDNIGIAHELPHDFFFSLERSICGQILS